jgi:hypothetical protein
MQSYTISKKYLQNTKEKKDRAYFFLDLNHSSRMLRNSYSFSAKKAKRERD